MPRKVIFECEGFPVSIMVCSHNVPAEEADCWIRSFQKWEKECVEMIGKKVLSFDGKSFKVDWEAYLRLKRCNKDIHNECDRILKDVGIFSFSPVNNWEIVGSGHLNLSPWSLGGSVLYFTREEDVVAYARLEYGSAMYGWHIQQIARVIPGN